TGGTADRNRSHWSTSKTPSYTKSVSWQHHQLGVPIFGNNTPNCDRNSVNLAPPKIMAWPIIHPQVDKN
ncbi:hypothetical protein LHL11_12765, partial [Escherichia coli]|uniref:hypothetical protein n=1 Tax=Escherichia coli TaxID=562 RepID=UPI001CF9C978